MKERFVRKIAKQDVKYNDLAIAEDYKKTKFDKNANPIK